MPEGEVFCISDFNKYASDKTISKILGRLCKQGACTKIIPGVFMKPNGKDPDISKMANAIARSNDWSVAPCGETALHLIGLEEDQPTIWTYITDGHYRSYCIGQITITFKHATKKIFSEISDETLQFVQILSAYRDKLKVRIPCKEQIQKLTTYINTYFSKAQKTKIYEEAGKLSQWLNKVASLLFMAHAKENQ